MSFVTTHRESSMIPKPDCTYPYAIPGSQLNVLVVDDQAYNIFVMEELLKDVVPSINIDTAYNG